MDDGNVLVAYFSRAGQNYVSGSIENLPRGNAEVIAGFAAEATGGDLFKIRTAEEYSTDYYACTDQAKEEKVADARPELATHVENMAGYGTVMLVHPNWWGTMPMVVYAFLEEYNFAGKSILPICTHEGSGLSGTEADIARVCNKAHVGRGLAVSGSRVGNSRADVRSWIAANARC